MTCCYFECLMFPAEVKQNKDNIDENPLLEEGIPKITKKGKVSAMLQINSWRCDKFAQGKSFFCKLWQWIRGLWMSKRFRKCRKITCILLFTLVLLALLTAFVGLPLVFMNSIAVQRSFIFDPTTAHHAEFFGEDDVKVRVHNFYVTVKPQNNSLGVWDIARIPINRDTYDNYERTSETFKMMPPLKNSSKPVVLFFHSESGNRRTVIMHLREISIFFRVIAFDYRSYGDSSAAELTEEGLVQDSVELYRWVQSQTNADIYIWGDVLGAAIAARTVQRLHENEVPRGLILLNAFTTLASNIESIWLGQMLSWLPWYKSTVLNGLEQNKFMFKTSEYIEQVDCPILILHQDNGPAPKSDSYELYDIAGKKRDLARQGGVIFSPLSNWYYYSVADYTMKNFVYMCDKFWGKNATT